MLEQIQRDLFALGARLADPGHKIAGTGDEGGGHGGDIARLEGWIDALDSALPPLRRFILAGGIAAGRRAAPRAHRLPARRARNGRARSPATATRSRPTC